MVYHFNCAGCNASYVGHTTRHLTTRIKEHLGTDKNSHIFKHLHSSVHCRSKCTGNEFKVIDSAQSKYSLKLKEYMHIEWLKPNLNIQKKYEVSMTLLI